MLFHYHHCVFFTAVLTGSFSLKSKWQQISSGFQDSSKYSNWSYECCGLDGLIFFSDLQFLQSPFQVQQLQLVSLSPSCFTTFSALKQDPSICLFFYFLLFSLCGPLEQQNPLYDIPFFLINTRSSLLAGIGWSVCIWKFQRILSVSFTKTKSGLCIYHLSVWPIFNLLHNFLWSLFPPSCT